MTTRCPECHSANVRTDQAPDDQFPGHTVPVRVCNSCGETWEDENTFAARSTYASTKETK